MLRYIIKYGFIDNLEIPLSSFSWLMQIFEFVEKKTQIVYVNIFYFSVPEQ